MGILITYAGYYRKDTPLTRTAFTVSLLDLLVAVMMGLIIFPAITSFGLQNESMQGATLVFVTLPEVFVQLPGTQVWAALFFLLITIAALTSTISIAEVSVKFVCDRWHLSRRSAVLIVLLPLLVFSSVCSLSMGPWSDITICGKTYSISLTTWPPTSCCLPARCCSVSTLAGLPRAGFLPTSLQTTAICAQAWPP